MNDSYFLNTVDSVSCKKKLIGTYAEADERWPHGTETPFFVDLSASYTLNIRPFCEPCYTAKFSEKCAGCQKPLSGEFLKAMGKSFHTECFACTECRKPFTDGRFCEVSLCVGPRALQGLGYVFGVVGVGLGLGLRLGLGYYATTCLRRRSLVMSGQGQAILSKACESSHGAYM